MKRFSMPVFVLVFACLMGLAICRADELAAVTGLVTDANGRSVPGVTVLITNLSTNVTSRTVTNDQGIYRVPYLQPGIYRMTLDKDGFKSIVKSGIELHVQDVASINFELQVGSVNETVTVTAGAPLVNTKDASVSTVVDRRFVENLPLNGRTFQGLLQLTPGVVIATPTGTSRGQFSVNGQRTDANFVSVDGVSANFGTTSSGLGDDGTGGTPALTVMGTTSGLVSVEALEEFRVQTSSYAPEFGHNPGGQVSIITRSGTNDLHGGLYEYFRNDKLDANDWFANASQIPRAPERLNDFGGFLGGPVIHNKTFFFISYEGLRLRLPQTTIAQVPSLSARSSAPSRLAPFLNAYPQPNGPISPNGTTARFTGSFSNPSTQDSGSVRIDHAFNNRVTIFGRANFAPSDSQSRVRSLSEVDTNHTDTMTVTLGSNVTFTPHLSITFRANYSTQKADISRAVDSFGGATPPDSALFLPGLSAPTQSSTSFRTLDTSFYGFGPVQKNRTKQLNFVTDVQVAIGTHQLKTGVDYRGIFYATRIPAVFLTYSATSVQSLLSTGRANVTGSTEVPNIDLLFHCLGAYVQDTWAVLRRLTLIYGVRWEFDPSPSGRNGTTIPAWMNVDNPSLVALAPAGTPLWNDTHNNFAPRVGAAYQLDSRGTTVVRAAWGIFYDLPVSNVSGITGLYPLATSQTFLNQTIPVASATSVTPTISLSPPYPGTPRAYSPDLKLPRSYQWNVSLEKAFGSQAASITYVGQAGRDLLRLEQELRPNTNFAPGAALGITRNSARSDYHALQLQYRRPVARGLQALANYTWSHSIDTGSSDVLNIASNTVISGDSDRGSSDFDVRHSFSVALSYSVPSFGKRSWPWAIARNWSFDGLAVARSGLPFNGVVFNSGGVPNTSTRPDLVPGVPVWLDVPTAPGGKSLNPAAFVTPTTVRQGTEGRNSIPGFGFTQIDCSASRRFMLTERFGLRFRADLFNALNHPNFANPQAFIGFGATFLSSTQMLNRGLAGGSGGLNPLFGQGGPRSAQLSLMLTF